MQITITVVLAILAIVLFVSKRFISNEALERAANVGGVIAVIAALVVLAFFTFSPESQNERINSNSLQDPTSPISPNSLVADAVYPTEQIQIITPTAENLFENPTSTILQQVTSTETGNNIRKTYEVSLYENEVIVGYGNKFENNYDCIAFIITGPGTYKFWLESGVWSKWTNVSTDDQGQLLQKQVDTLSNYCDVAKIKPIKIFASSMPSNESNSSSTLSPICGEQAFDSNLKTSDPIFRNSNNYFFGWISSDKATIELPNGTTKTLNTQFVLIAENIPYVQIKGVELSSGTANINGCWYPDNTFYEQIAKEEICRKKANNQIASYIKVTQTGFSELGITTSITCP